MTVTNTRRELGDVIWAQGNWAAYTVDEDERDLNGDGDMDDSLLTVLDLRSLKFQDTRLALDTSAGVKRMTGSSRSPETRWSCRFPSRTAEARI